jgi:FimV-like protein
MRNLQIENETVKELLDQVDESKTKEGSSFEMLDLIFISLISLASGALLALIFIQLRSIKNSKEQEYDFEEAKDDDSMLSGLPKGLSIENNEDQQQLDLATTYFAMDDKVNAKRILSNLLKESDSNQIKKEAKNLLSKIN